MGSVTQKPNPICFIICAETLLEERLCLVLEETSAWCNESRKTAPAWSGGDGGRLHAHREEQSELPRNGGFNKSKIRKPRGSSTVCYFFV